VRGVRGINFFDFLLRIIPIIIKKRRWVCQVRMEQARAARVQKVDGVTVSAVARDLDKRSAVRPKQGLDVEKEIVEA